MLTPAKNNFAAVRAALWYFMALPPATTAPHKIEWNVDEVKENGASAPADLQGMDQGDNRQGWCDGKREISYSPPHSTTDLDHDPEPQQCREGCTAGWWLHPQPSQSNRASMEMDPELTRAILELGTQTSCMEEVPRSPRFDSVVGPRCCYFQEFGDISA